MDLHAKDIAAALALQNAPRQDAPAIDRDKTTTTAPAPKAFEEALSAYAAIATDVFRYNQAVAAWHGKTEKLGAPPRLDPLVPQRLSDLARQGSLPNAWSLHAESSACWYAIAEDLLIDSGDKAAPTYRDALEKGMQAERDVIIALGTTYSPAYMPSAHLDREHRLAYYANFSSVFHRQDRNRLCRTKPMQDFFGDNGAGPMSTRVMRTAWPASVLLSRITLSPEEVDSAIVAMHQPGSQSPKIRDSMLTGILGRSLPHPDHAWLARLAREYEGDPLGNTAQILLMKDINGTMGDDEVRGAP
jgi:hypothetical protein